MKSDVRRLRVEVALMKRGHGRRYEARLRARIAGVARRLRDDGASWHEIGEALGIPFETVRRFAMAAGNDSRSGGFVPVEIAPAPTRAPLVLVTPTGHRVEGLDLETLAILLARLT